ncbi:MAG: hypothetical protein JOZ72_08250 [Alphaproteobacteria bacterium]|nr:hypothetical protein [Alphaproteobacteria bacterium]
MALSFEDMLDEFRALGGIADNICIKQGRFGRGLFPVDPAKPARVGAPDHLLVGTDHVVFENGALRIGPGSGLSAREKAFIEAYEQEFSWGPSRGELAELLEMFAAAPPELRAVLDKPLNVDGWLAEPNDKAVQERFFASRAANYNGRTVLMPVVDLVNHGSTGTYLSGGGGVGVEGTFSGEVLAGYQLGDPLRIFARWGFASPEPLGLSLAMRAESGSGPIAVKRSPIRRATNRMLYPDVSLEDGVLVLSYLLLGHRDYPRLPKANFYRIMRDAGRGDDAEEAFDKIQHINRVQFVRLIRACEGAAPPLACLLREVGCLQLEALSNYAGTVDI